MDKKNIIIAVSWIALGILAIEYKNLVHDFKLGHKTLVDNEEKFEAAKEIVTEVMFSDIVENYDED